MSTFFKTFFICLILTFSFLVYKFVSEESYNDKLSVSNDNPVFKQIEITPKEQVPLIAPKNTETETKKDVEPPKVQKNKLTCYFYSNSGKLTPLAREINLKPTLDNLLTLLLKGPTIQESKQGYYSEIPQNVSLISITQKNNSVIVNLGSNFGNGGGSQSIENRIKQLSKTIKAFMPNKDIYLYIDGKEVEYLGGDGVYIKQPLD